MRTLWDEPLTSQRSFAERDDSGPTGRFQPQALRLRWARNRQAIKSLAEIRHDYYSYSASLVQRACDIVATSLSISSVVAGRLFATVVPDAAPSMSCLVIIGA
jgi:hypothetical protein